MPSDAQTAAGAMADTVKLAERYEIQPGAPLPALNAVGGNAFTAKPLREKRLEAFAIICHASTLPRTDICATVASLDNGTHMRLLDWGLVDWPQDRGRRYCLMFEKPGGRRLMTSINETYEPMPEEQLTRQIVHPLVSALKEMSGRGVVHGAIRPTNLYFRDLASGGLMLGESVSAQPGYGQPVLLETIERGMAMPAGRGTGSAADDMYSLGVTLLMLALGRNPVAGLDDEAIVQAKIERGSYPALVNQHRLPLAVNEMVRGLLVDDPKQRWTLNDLDLWVAGRRLSPKQPQISRRASRPIEFQGQEYWHCRTLARAFARQVPAAAMVIESGELDKWLRRSMGDELRAEAVNNAVQTASTGKGGSQGDRLVARVCMALDPTAPIRYRGRAMMPDGIGTMLADAFMRGESPQAPAEVVTNQLPMFWANVQSEFKPEFVPLVQTYDQLRGFLERSAYGLGVERVLYEMNPTMPCMSPLVAKQLPTNPSELLRALDWLAAGGQRHKDPVDRHIAAFLGARHKRGDDLLFTQLGSGVEPMRRVIAMLTILSDVQARTGVDGLTHLAAWVVALLEPAFRRFHNRPQQEVVRKQADGAAHNGRLTELLKVVDDPESLRRDRLEFEAAQIAYREADAEMEKVRHTIADRNAIVESSGRQVAAITSSLLSTVMVAGIILFFAF
ncbi:serine/threonine protein kinase [Azospirillum doebereinerae]|uniref:non-specific serine/threonine protein kinase n=1 Tax=Azospirillum doebereinerae TaxID=92933 RepID=A0A3S0XJN2_9PROT|nr:serine/threonine protein kinase [Azospirillum doebereinerae]MCG5243982.1 serine/threonine protein kinase [Azospirillum doebereinerae]RUQ65957.1 serine/threonine protein kinase [Azospirillum doebereinerae]